MSANDEGPDAGERRAHDSDDLSKITEVCSAPEAERLDLPACLDPPMIARADIGLAADDDRLDRVILIYGVLVAARKAGVSLRALARFSGISKSALHREWPDIEAGARIELSTQTKLRLASYEIEIERESARRHPTIEGAATPLLSHLGHAGQPEPPITEVSPAEVSQVGHEGQTDDGTIPDLPTCLDRRMRPTVAP